MKAEDKMKLLLVLSCVQVCLSRREVDHKFVTGFVVTPEKKDALEERKGREIVEIIPEATTASSFSQYPIDCTNEKECEAAAAASDTTTATFRPYSQEELDSFLKKYVEEHGKPTETPRDKLSNLYMDDPANVLEGLKEKSKSWQLMQSQQHKHPYDDRTGWVSLEPIPWSASQIQKWEPNRRPPQIPQWEEQEHYRPNKWQERPWNKPTYDYKPSQKPYEYNKPGWSDSYGSGSDDIITDGRPGSFPSDYHQSKPYHNKQHETKEQLPGDGDGRWVLLSSTKGYSQPHRSRAAYQRALLAPAGQQVKSHRSVRLTVLPPEDGKTTVSHDGLIEVEKSGQTVDESQREHAAKMMKLGQDKEPSAEPIKRAGTVRTRVYPVRVQHPRSNAMLAAVGAGMIPATMAMLLPMVLGRRRRRSLDRPLLHGAPKAPAPHYY